MSRNCGEMFTFDERFMILNALSLKEAEVQKVVDRYASSDIFDEEKQSFLRKKTSELSDVQSLIKKIHDAY